jgi:hypothetical protein
MAAEMSTGVLALAHLNRRNPPVSMLVVKVESQYHKKATGITLFTCDAGTDIRQVIDDAINSGEGKAIRVQSIGKNANGEIVAEFWITWSFKARL